MQKKPQAMIRLLKQNGFVEVKCNKGSHRRFINPTTGRKTEFPCMATKN